jgi:serine/threonine protein kinase
MATGSPECLTENAIAELLAGKRRLLDRADLEAHLAQCPTCRALLATAALDSIARSDTVLGSKPPPPPDGAGADGRLPRGAALGRYLVLDVIGQGGMGVVYAAYDPELDRKVAVKVLRARDGLGGDSPSGRARMLREGQAMARLSHPNVVPVHDVGTHAGHVFVAMEWVDGQTLRAWVDAAPRGWREVVAMYTGAARGLAAAHDAALVHRDFKPDNVIVGRDGRARVVDFGLARASGGPQRDPAPDVASGSSPLESPLTREGTVVGTPARRAISSASA